MPNEDRCRGAKWRVFNSAERATIAGGVYMCIGREENVLCIVIAVIVALVVAAFRVQNPLSNSLKRSPATSTDPQPKRGQSALPTKQEDPTMDALEARLQKQFVAHEKKVKREIDEDRKEIDACKEEIAAHKKEIAAHKKEIAAHKKEIVAHKKEIIAHKSEINALDSRLAAIESIFNIREMARIVESLLVQVINDVLAVHAARLVWYSLF
nr:hypothetical protein [Pandoravirus belohorizontensis]